MKNELSNIEFFRFEKEMWYRNNLGENCKLTEDDRDIIAPMYDVIKSVYPKAYSALKDLYYRKFNCYIKRYQFKVVEWFLRCNFGRIDNTLDINARGCFNFEHVECPLRGMCKYEDVICNPEIDTTLGNCEREVLELVFKGYTQAEIALSLGKAQDTVHNQIFRGYKKLGVNEKSEFIHYAYTNKLFKTE